MSVLFSIVIPVYKAERFLNKCIESVLNQTYSTFELILVDDGSPDNSGKICDDYAVKDSRITVIHKENGGATSARKAGVMASKGDYVICVDADDSVDLKLLAEINEIIESTGPEIVAYTFGNYEQKLKCGFYEGDLSYIYERMICNCDKPFYTFGVIPALWSKAFKRDLLLDSLQRVDEKIVLGEDMTVSAYAFLQAKSVYITDKPLYNYNDNDTSITSTYNIKKSDDLKRLVLYLYNNFDVEKYKLKEQLDVYIHLRLDDCTNVCEQLSYKKSKEIMREACNAVSPYVLKNVRTKDKKYKLVRLLFKYRLWFIIWVLKRM